MRPPPGASSLAFLIPLFFLIQLEAAAAVAAVLPLAVAEDSSNSRLTCSEALHHFLGNLSRSYLAEENSMVVEGPEEYYHLLPAVCGTEHYSIELWRAIMGPGSSLPQDFGTKEYFSKYQNCDNPNPDLLWKHGDSIKASVGGSGVGGGSGASGQKNLRLWTRTERVVFYHVVEQQYILRMCPCNNTALPCSCEHAGQGSATCSEVFNISNPYREKVFPWCRGDGTPAPRPQLNAPKLQHCPAQAKLLEYRVVAGPDDGGLGGGGGILYFFWKSL
jgi:hypothetical protein